MKSKKHIKIRDKTSGQKKDKAFKFKEDDSQSSVYLSQADDNDVGGSTRAGKSSKNAASIKGNKESKKSNTVI
jgi:hypothetical protein